MHRAEADSALRYVAASRLQCAAGDLAELDFRGSDDRKFGTLDGVVIDTATRRLRFYVVEAQGWFRSRRFLLPAEWPARIDAESRALRVEMDADDVARCEDFDSSDVPEQSDDDLIDSMFRHRVA